MVNKIKSYCEEATISGLLCILISVFILCVFFTLTFSLGVFVAMNLITCIP